MGGRKKGPEKLSDAVSQAYRQWHDKLVAAVRLAMPADEPYMVSHTQNLVGVRVTLFLFVDVSEAFGKRSRLRKLSRLDDFAF